MEHLDKEGATHDVFITVSHTILTPMSASIRAEADGLARFHRRVYRGE
jgi:hypothetical protein